MPGVLVRRVDQKRHPELRDRGDETRLPKLAVVDAEEGGSRAQADRDQSQSRARSVVEGRRDIGLRGEDDRPVEVNKVS